MTYDTIPRFRQPRHDMFRLLPDETRNVLYNNVHDLTRNALADIVAVPGV